jgi:5-(carboxyamino)imidazole ribonucleotide synthase
MFNLIGSHPPKEALLQIPEAHLHLYRKGAAPGRKIGHVTVVSPTPERLEEVSQRVVRCLGEHF